MRTLEITPAGGSTSVGELVVPEAVSFRNDRTTVTITSYTDTDRVGAKIKVTNPSGRYLEVEYNSERPSLMFLLDDTIENLWEDSDSAWTFLINPYINSVAYPAQSLLIKIPNGKTLPFRTHGSAKTIYWSDQLVNLNPLRVFSFGVGTLTWGLHSANLVLGVNAINLSNWHVPNKITFNITSNNQMNAPAHGGSIWNDSYIPNLLNRDINLIYQEHCGGYNYVNVYYRDIDGCPRGIMGSVTKEKYTTDKTMFKRYEQSSVIKDAPHRKITANKGTVTVAFTDIRRDAYITDMMFSNDIYIADCNGMFTPVILASSDVSNVRDEVEDYTFDFQIMQ